MLLTTQWRAPVWLVLRSLPGAGVYKEWHQLATAQYVRVLPVTPHEVSRALSEHSSPQLIASLTRRAQSDAFIHVEPVTNELEFFGRTQLERLVIEPSVVPGCHSGTNRPQPVAVPFGSAVPTIIGTPLDHPNGRLLTPSPAVDTDTSEPAAPSGPRRVERVGIGEGTIMLTTPPPDEQRALRELMARICEPSELQIIAHDLGIRLDRIVSLDHGTELQALKLIDGSIRSGCYDRLKALVHARAPAVFDL